MINDLSADSDPGRCINLTGYVTVDLLSKLNWHHSTRPELTSVIFINRQKTNKRINTTNEMTYQPLAGYDCASDFLCSIPFEVGDWNFQSWSCPTNPDLTIPGGGR